VSASGNAKTGECGLRGKSALIVGDFSSWAKNSELFGAGFQGQRER
jgi:hypothetical protein